MKDELTLRDFYRFLVDNIKIILISIIVLGITAVGFVIYSHIVVDETDTPGESPVELTGSSLSQERYEEMADWPIELFSESQIRSMQSYLLPSAYKVTIYAEHESYEPIANTNFMRQVFRNNEVLSYIESEIGGKLTPNIDFAIHIVNISNSGIYELHFQRATPQESLELGYIVMDAIENDVIPVLNNKNVYFVNQNPEPVVQDYSEYYDDNFETGEISIRRVIRDILIYGLISAVVGLFIGIGLAILKTIFGSKITALYNYERHFSDKIVRLNNISSNTEDIVDKVKQNIIFPRSENKLILVEDNSNKITKTILKELTEMNNLLLKNDFSKIDKGASFDEVLIITEVNNTHKKWYNTQRIQLNGYQIPIKVIQIS